MKKASYLFGLVLLFAWLVDTYRTLAERYRKYEINAEYAARRDGWMP